MATNTMPSQKIQNDVDTIRAILFGEQIQDFQERITVLEKLVSALQAENDQLKASIEEEKKRGDDRFVQEHELLEATKSDLAAQLYQLESKLSSDSSKDRNHFQQALDTQAQTTASQLSDLRAEFSELIQAHQLKQDALIEALAKALLAYQSGK